MGLLWCLVLSVLSVLAACPTQAAAAPFTFSVWAPHATAVSVTPVNSQLNLTSGRFPPHTRLGGRASWSTTSMKAVGNGTWVAAVDGVQAGDRYNFVISNQQTLTRIDPRCVDVAFDGQGNAASVVPAPYTFRHGPVQVSAADAVVYELHVGSFTQEGTFASAQAKLPFLAQLGVTLIELMPIAESCGDASGWGYCPKAFYAVRPELGGALGLKQFVDAAAALGMGVAVDVVFNHADSGSLLIDFDGSGGQDSGPDGIYFYSGQFLSTPWGPRPNFASAIVRQYFADLVGTLARDFHISGFRWDSTSCIRMGGSSPSDNGCTAPNADGWALMQQGNTATQGTFRTAEDAWGPPFMPAITQPVNSPTAKGPPGTTGGAGFDTAWGYPWHFAMVNEVTKGQDSAIDAQKIASVCTGTAGFNGSNLVLFSENHDVSSNQHQGRIPHRINPNNDPNVVYWAEKKSMLLMGLAFACPGTPMLLQGQEFLTSASFDFPDPPKLDWSLASTYAGLVQEVTDMLKVRASEPALRSTRVSVLNVTNDANNKVVVLLRSAANTEGSERGTQSVVGSVASKMPPLSLSASGAANVVVAFNFRKITHQSYRVNNIPFSGTLTVRFNGDATSYSSGYDNACAGQTTVSVQNGLATLCIPPMSMLVLSQA